MADSAHGISVAERVDPICSRFEQDFKAGKKPAIERYLGESQEPFRSALLQAVIELEIALRTKQGEKPSQDDYLARFPKHAEVIGQAFTQLRSILSSVKVSSAETAEGPQLVLKDSTADSAPLKTLGRFQIVTALGEGAFGTVYKAHDPQLDRDVAIKVPRTDALQTPADRERFMREARAAAGLQNASICPVYEVGTIDGRDYIVMSFIDGKPLSKVIQTQNQFTERQVVSVVRKIALGLFEAHEKGIIHRDLKPANIMINRKGEPVVMDFGLARRSNSADAQISQSGQIMGTPAYMSPEQARGDGKSVGASADIYSLGVIFYELLCGRRPFEGTITEVIGQILHVEVTPPSKHRAGVDSGLEKVCMKMLAKKASDRFASMKEVAAALTEYLKTGSTIRPKSTATVAKEEPEGSMHTQDFARLMEVVSFDLEEKVERAATRAVRKSRKKQKKELPWWVYMAGSALTGVIILLGILFFVKKDTVTVIVNIPIENKNDPSLSFFLDKKAIAAAAFDAPIELKPGEHELVINRDEKLFRRFLFNVSRKNDGPVVPQDVTPEPEVVEAKPAAPAPNPPADSWVELFNGRDLSNWVSLDGKPAGWKVENGYVENVPGSKSIYTRDNFPLDYDLHLEFWLPKELQHTDQKRANSGVYLSGRHEIQICDAFDNPIGNPKVAVGALYGEIPTTMNAAAPPETWQTFDITFRAPRVDGQKNVTTPGRLTVIHNDKKIIDNQSINTPGSPGRQNDNFGQPGPILLQDHGSKTRFRNIRLRPIKGPSIPGDAQAFQGHSYKFYPQKVKWTEAKARCEALGGHLMIVDSLEENAFAGKLVEAAGWIDAWIGATDQDKEGEWKTVDGKPLAFTNWGVGQPNNKPPGEHWALISNIKVDNQPYGWKWSDQPDDSSQHNPGYLCEWDALPDGSVDISGFIPLFNGRDLTGWQGNPAHWTVHDGVLIGKMPEGKQKSYSYLVTQRPFRDFELKMVTRLVSGNSGVQIRSSIVDQTTFDMHGPQVEIAPGDQVIWGTLVTAPTHQPSVVAQINKVKEVLRPNDFNELTIRCVGVHVTVALNGTVVNDTDFPTSPPDGLIGLQLHQNHPGMEIRFREILIRGL